MDVSDIAAVIAAAISVLGAIGSSLRLAFKVGELTEKVVSAARQNELANRETRQQVTVVSERLDTHLARHR